MDGSCSRHVIRELSRAAYALVFLNAAGTMVAYAKGAVWSMLQQTPQAAEHQAMAIVPIFVEYSGNRYSDCATVTKLCNKSWQHQCYHKHKYAGMRRGPVCMRNGIISMRLSTPQRTGPKKSSIASQSLREGSVWVTSTRTSSLSKPSPPPPPSVPRGHL